MRMFSILLGDMMISGERVLCGGRGFEKIKTLLGKDRFPTTREDDSTGISIYAAEE